MRLFGLIGQPLTHSFSKKYFTEKFEKEGNRNCRYELFPLQSINELEGLLRSNPDLEGLNITIPYKQQVLPYLDSTPGIPDGIAACNCIKIQGNQLIGFNTDIAGFEKSFAPLLQSWHQSALVLGNGGATAAIVYVLKKRGIAVRIVSRSLHKDSSLVYADLDEKIMNENLIIINTTPLGTFPLVDDCPPIPYQYIGNRHYLFDVVYNPPQSVFLQNGRKQGALVKNGSEMLEIQAEESWRIWNE